MPSRGLSQKDLELQLDAVFNEDYPTLPSSKWNKILQQVRGHIESNYKQNTKFVFRGTRSNLDQIIPLVNTLIDEMRGEGFRIVDIRNHYVSSTELHEFGPIFDLSSGDRMLHLAYSLSYR